MTAPVLADGPVERFLDELFDRLAGTGAEGRRAFVEAEDHLRSATAAGVAAGLSLEAAEAEAVRRFGAARSLAHGMRSVHTGPKAWLRPAFVGCWLAGGLGFVAIGVSGLVAELFGRLWGASFVAGDAPGVTYTAQRCDDYFEYVPNASSCADAAAQHHWGEVVDSRVTLGVLGLLALLVLWFLRRTTPLGRPAWTPPRLAVGVPLGIAFALAALGLGGLGLMELAFHDTDMVGTYLAGGIAAAVAATVTGVWLAGAGRRRHAGS